MKRKCNTYMVIGIFIAIMTFLKCTETTSSTEIYQSSDFQLSWKLLSEVDLTNPEAHCAFYLKNKGKNTLYDRWKLYFNQSPRSVTSIPNDSPASVQHISGDWFVLTPHDGFTLSPGDSVTFEYMLSYLILKESDAALHPYLVFNEGEKESIVDIPDYTIQDFEWLKNLESGQKFSAPVPTPEQRFSENQGASLIDESDLVTIIPSPRSYRNRNGEVEIDNSWTVHHQNLENMAQYLVNEFKDLSDIKLTTESGPAVLDNVITIQLNNALGEENYRIDINSNRIQIRGGDEAGVFYGIQSLLQLIPLSDIQNNSQSIKLPAARIDDGPRFKYRGLHIDVARNFQTIDQLKKMIDVMAYYKLNTMQLYLSEDEGWRIEIPGLPELTEVGSKRGHTLDDENFLHPSYGSGPFTDDPLGSGFYTRSEYIALLRYAQDKHVTIIPTINFPAHARAAIKAMEKRYRTYKAQGNDELALEYRLIDPADTSKYRSAQAYHDNVVCVVCPGTFRFYEKVVDEVIAMHDEAGVELEIFHTGGDEVPNGAWSGSPISLEAMDTISSVDDPRNFQRYFFDWAVKMLERRGLRSGAWQEAVFKRNTSGEFDIIPEYAEKGVVPYVWQTLGHELDLGYRLANIDYDVVLCNVQNFYFDLAYNPDPEEPGLYWGGFVKTKSAWSVPPIDLLSTVEPDDPLLNDLKRLRNQKKDRIIGLQAQLWSETIKGGEMMEYYTLPKLMGFSERAWSESEWENLPASDRRTALKASSWNKFANILGQSHLPKLAYLKNGYNYRIPLPGVRIQQGRLESNIEFPGLTIRYTTDGSDPTSDSPVYTRPIELAGTTKLKAYDKAGNSGRTVIIQ